MDKPLAQIAGTMERILGVRQRVDRPERTRHKMAQHVDQFCIEQAIPAVDDEEDLVVETADGKGAPILSPGQAHRDSRPAARDATTVAGGASVLQVSSDN